MSSFFCFFEQKSISVCLFLAALLFSSTAVVRETARLAHHHLAELVEIHSSGSVLVDLLDDAVQVLFGQPLVKFGDDLAELAGRDESLEQVK